MTRHLWSEMYRAHTCFKAFSDMLPKLRAGDLVRLKSAQAPPCRPCRAWWAQCVARYSVKVHFEWPGGTWRAEVDPRPSAPPHNQVLEDIYSDRGMTVFAAENQNCALWGFPEGTSGDSEVFQSDLGNKDYGPWLPTGLTKSVFLQELDLWNQANGGAPVSAFGQGSPSTTRLFDSLDLILASPDFTIRKSGVATVALATGGDAYVWSDDEQAVRSAVRALELQWDDLEY